MPNSTAPRPAPDRRCRHCGEQYHASELLKGRGRQYGQHPEHLYAPCCPLSQGQDRRYCGARVS